jgi:hypothetical protein
MAAYQREVKLGGISADELFGLLTRESGRLGDLLPGGVTIKPVPEKRCFDISGSVFKGTISCRDGVVSVDGQLGFLASAFRSKIDSEIDKWVKGFASQGNRT